MLRMITPLLAVTLVASVPLAGQAPDARAALAARLDSLRTIASADDAQRGAMDASAAYRRSDHTPLDRLRYGLALLRAGQLGDDRRPLDAAQQMFDEAILRSPSNWPWPWFALALADFSLDSIGVTVKPSMHQGLGVYYRTAALTALTGALDADSTFAPAAELLGQVLLPYGDRQLSGDLRRAVRHAVRSDYPAAWLALGRVYRNLDAPDSSLRAFHEYVRSGGDPGVGALEQARQLYAMDRVGAADSTYLHGLADAGAAGRVAYRTDLSWIATAAELAAYDSLAADSLTEFVQRFWSKRDAEELRAPGERLAEHMRRWLYVMNHFQVIGRQEGVRFASNQDIKAEVGDFVGGSDFGPGTPAPVDSTQSIDMELFEAANFAATKSGRRIVDDRGIIYMRHGEPALVRSEPGDIHTPPNLAWSYNAPGGKLVFIFVPSLRLGINAPTTLTFIAPTDTYIRDGLASLDSHFFTAPERYIAAMLRQDIRAGLTTDSYARRFRTQLEPLVQFFGVGQADRGTGQLLAVFALRGDRLEPTLIDGNVTYPVTLHLIATDSAGRVERAAATRYFRTSDTLGKGQYLTGIASMPLDAGRWNVRLLAVGLDTTRGGAAGRNGMTLSRSDSLSLSDLVFGVAGSGLSWTSPAGPVPLNPLDAYRRDATLEVYYEVSGVTAGKRYRTELAIEGFGEGARGTVRLSFEETARGPVLRIRRSVSLDALTGGQYRMTVTVTDTATSRHASRSRYVNVLAD